MTGIHLTKDHHGNPTVLTIDLHNLDPDAVPFVGGILDLLAQRLEDAERADWIAAAHDALNRGYGNDEPNYDDVSAMSERTSTNAPNERR